MRVCDGQWGSHPEAETCQAPAGEPNMEKRLLVLEEACMASGIPDPVINGSHLDYL